jgi:hypothetical protein
MSLDRLSEAKQTLQRGDKLLARKLVSQVLYSDPRNEQAWLLMARLVDSEGQLIECLERALRINRDNVSTQNALKVLKRRAASHAKPSQPSPGAISPAHPVSAASKPPAQPRWRLYVPSEKSNGKNTSTPTAKPTGR